MKEYAYVNNAREWTEEEKKNQEILDKFNAIEEKKATFKVIAKRVGGPLTKTMLAVAVAAALFTLAPTAVEGLKGAQVQQSAEANLQMYQNTYKWEPTEEEKLAANADFYNEQKLNATRENETLTPGTKEYEDNQKLINEAELMLMSIREKLGIENSHSGPTK